LYAEVWVSDLKVESDSIAAPAGRIELPGPMRSGKEVLDADVRESYEWVGN